MVPADRLYTREHEWILVQNGRGRVGITHYAQEQLGDVVYVELPAVGIRVEQFKPFGLIDSVKASSELYAPATGTVTAVNEQVREHPELVNQDPYGAGWLIEISLENPDELRNLLTADQYQSLISQA